MIRYYETLRGVDPQWEKKLVDLRRLVAIAGSPGRLAELLGIPVKTVYSFARSGQISPVGALLVESSRELGSLFKAADLRPELRPALWAFLKKSKRYKDARAEQKQNEATMKSDDRSPLRALEGIGVTIGKNDQ